MTYNAGHEREELTELLARGSLTVSEAKSYVCRLTRLSLETGLTIEQLNHGIANDAETLLFERKMRR